MNRKARLYAVPGKTRDNPGLNALATQVGVSVAGAFVLLAFMMAAVPLIRYFFWPFFFRGVVAAMLAGALSIIYNWRYNRALYALSRSAAANERLPEDQVEKLEETASRLPLRLLFLTLLLWPATTLLLGFWMNLAGFLGLADAMRLGVTGVLYSPLQGFIFYFLARLSMRGLVRFLHSSGNMGGYVITGRWGLKSRLVWSFACLALIPLLAGVLLYGVQKEHDAVEKSLDKTCLALEALHAAGSGKNGAWEEATKEVLAGVELPSSARFLVVDENGELLAGGMGWEARQVWSRESKDRPSPGTCRVRPVPGTRQYVAMRYFPDPGVLVSASLHPLSRSDAFFFFSGTTLITAFLVVGLAVLLGYLAADDVIKTLHGISGEAAKLAKGRYSPVSGFLADREMQELVDSLNTLSGSMKKELKRSEEIMQETGNIISELASCSAELRSHAQRQREILDEHSPMVSRAGDKADELAAAAGAIRNEAQGSRDSMGEVFQKSRSAGETLQHLQEIIKGIDEASGVLVRDMEKVESNYRRMEEVVTIIDDVADRSEMVALNASLESSGGEGGRSRFSVVASEIQRLSENISRQTSAIKAIFGEVKNASVEMVQYIEINRDKSSGAPEWSAKLMQTLEGIRSKAHRASAAVEKIEKRAEEQNSSLEQMRMAMGEIKSMTDIMDQTSQGTESTSGKLADLSKRLEEIVSDRHGQKPD
ncbi:MAG: methyl-accepting chemotaxis protein [bacterium]